LAFSIGCLFFILISFSVNATHSIVGAAAPMDIGGRRMAGFASGVIDSFQYFGAAIALPVTGKLLDKYGWGAWYSNHGAVRDCWRLLHATGHAQAAAYSKERATPSDCFSDGLCARAASHFIFSKNTRMIPKALETGDDHQRDKNGFGATRFS